MLEAHSSPTLACDNVTRERFAGHGKSGGKSGGKRGREGGGKNAATGFHCPRPTDHALVRGIIGSRRILTVRNKDGTEGCQRVLSAPASAPRAGAASATPGRSTLCAVLIREQYRQQTQRCLRRGEIFSRLRCQVVVAAAMRLPRAAAAGVVGQRSG